MVVIFWSTSLVEIDGGVDVKVCFLYSAVPSPLDRSKRFTLFSTLADLFIPAPTRLLREAF